MVQFNRGRAAIMALCVLLGTVAVGNAQEGAEKFDRKAFGEKMQARIQAVYDQLSLSEEQKQLLDENKKSHQAVKDTLRQALTANMEASGEELKKDNFDLNKINALHEESKNIRNQMADDRLNGILAVRKILTKEQFIKFSELMQQDREKRW